MIAAILAACLVLLTGLAMVMRRKRKEAPVRPIIPKVWPLVPRKLVNSKERQIWGWLSTVMHDQEIMIKLPVTRFTMPAKPEEAMQWYDLLNRVYCTFTICSLDGRVIGCVDVPGHGGLSMSNQTLKYGLLTQCGIPYWVVEPDNLPHKSQIRTAFLGEPALPQNPPQRTYSRMQDVTEILHAAAARQKGNIAQPVHYDLAPVRSADSAVTQDDGPVSEGWEQNSFVVPLDSRAGGLQRE